MSVMIRTYLGDNVYVEIAHGILRLSADNGFGPSNEIFLEPEVFAALVNYVSARQAEPSEALDPMPSWPRAEWSSE